MSTNAKILQVLHILSENLKNPQPQLVPSTDIADRLQWSLAETQLLLKVMNDTGVIESNVDARLSLITQEGLHYLHQQVAL